MSSIHFSIKEKKNIKLPKKYFLPFSSKIQKSGNFIYMHNSEDVKIIDISVDPHFIESSFE